MNDRRFGICEIVLKVSSNCKVVRNEFEQVKSRFEYVLELLELDVSPNRFSHLEVAQKFLVTLQKLPFLVVNRLGDDLIHLALSSPSQSIILRSLLSLLFNVWS